MSLGYASISEDWGRTWEALPQGLNSGALTSSINALAASEGVFVAGMSLGYASISEDWGRTWEALPQGLNSGYTSASIRSLVASGSVFVAGMSLGYASISEDWGRTWEALPRGLNSGAITSSINALAASEGVFVAGMDTGHASISHSQYLTYLFSDHWELVNKYNGIVQEQQSLSQSIYSINGEAREKRIRKERQQDLITKQKRINRMVMEKYT